MNPLIQSKNTTILPVLIALTLGCFALSPQARAVCQDACLTNFNTVQGDDALFSLTTGASNTGMGFNALFNNTTGNNNTATGFQALFSNTDGGNNTANGLEALYSNTTGSFNTAIGLFALFSNTTGSFNTATGQGALNFNTIGDDNTANGFEALYKNTTGNFNTAIGESALFSNTEGGNNMASGWAALYGNTTGSSNTASGWAALFNNTTGNRNIALGLNAGSNLTTGSNNIDIGNPGVAGESKTIRIGNRNQIKTFIAGIRDVTTQNADAISVLIDSAGQLGTMSSSRRFKKEIKPMDQTSEAILGLKPVTFHYKGDSKSTPQFGLIAEEVAKVNPDLVARDAKGEIYTVRYEAVNAMLLNEFLKARRQIDAQQKQIEALTAGLQKVSAHLELSKPAPRTVNNP
jgi:hypothetical protein